MSDTEFTAAICDVAVASWALSSELARRGRDALDLAVAARWERLSTGALLAHLESREFLPERALPLDPPDVAQPAVALRRAFERLVDTMPADRFDATEFALHVGDLCREVDRDG